MGHKPSGMKKIIFFSNLSMNLSLFRMGLMRALRRNGWRVLAAAGRDSYSVLLEKEGFAFLPCSVDRKGKNPFQEALLLLRIFFLLVRERPDAIINFTIKPVIYASLASYFFPFKVINVVTGLGYIFIQRSGLTRFVKLLYRLAFKRADRVIFQNRDDRRFFIRERLVRSSRTEMIRSSGVDTRYFSPSARKKRGKGVVFLFMGRLLWDKGIKEFTVAVRRLRQEYPQAEARILGWIDKGNPASLSEEHLKEIEKTDGIKYLGRARDVRNHIRSSDVVVLPSYREGVPRSLLEAASMGKPLIATDVPGCREVVAHQKNGLLVPVKDAEALRAAMAWMIKNPRRRAEMGREGRRRTAARFSEEIIVKQYLKILNSLVS